MRMKTLRNSNRLAGTKPVPKSKRFKHVPHAPSDMMALVSNVEIYPEFINLLSAVRTSPKETVRDGVKSYTAEATVNYKFISERFKSLVTINSHENHIAVTKADKSGAVKSLTNDWVFHELSDGSTLVEFFVDVKLKAFPLEMLLRDKFDKAGAHIMNLFVVKASQMYEKVGDESLDLDVEMQRLSLNQKMADLS